ncbi:hypothetical protein KM924_23330 [Brevibacillus parabrevis]|uniref:hypothetical protein n=1 Tax=Brevibacillus parabrevis TaxID=54914 RepID=UPI001C22F18B|nr:hypothetical protein [Brevibacillus parabrevis]MBU8715436.1 hypothetical protein [Brevibacillus parabrevis]
MTRLKRKRHETRELCYRATIDHLDVFERFIHDICEGTTFDYAVATGGRERPHGKRPVKAVRLA